MNVILAVNSSGCQAPGWRWHPVCARTGVTAESLTYSVPRTLSRQARGAVHSIWDATVLFIDDQGLSWAGAIGLYLFLSVPPFMVAVTWLAGAFVGSSQAESFVVDQVAKYLPAEQKLLEGVVGSAPANGVAALASVLLLLFSGSRAFAAMTSAINVLWRRVDELTFVRRQALRLGLLAVTVGLLALAALGEAGIRLVAGLARDDGQLWLLDWQLLPSLLLAAFLLIAYKLLPREPVSWWHAAVGACAATVGIRLAQAGLGVMADAGTFRTPYGDLAGVALVATWALVVGVIVLWCAALVAALDGKRAGDGEPETRFSRGE